MIRQRCAIYTRKSTEEGLEQSFNSLDAQREACSAYILSQRHEGWSELSDRYDDGGFSGGSMERPGLQRLLADVRAGRLDVIVVYKVDRLTRALSDFAKMVEIFDAAGVSFVSVTQAFNTTSSMGRLTLNVLLSFAQFEREVTAERIRDKVATSKRKGMWMGGAVPFGYEAQDKALIVNADEADAVRTIFREYLKAGSVPALRRKLDRLPAGLLESVVHETILRCLLDRAWLTSVLATAGVRPEAIADALEQAPKDAFALSGASGMESLTAYLHRAELREGLISLRVNIAPLINDPAASEVLVSPIEVPITLQRNGRNRLIVLRADTGGRQRDPDLIALVADARRWMQDLVDGRLGSVAELTGREQLRPGAISRILPLAWLAPDIAQAILEGSQPVELTAKALRDLPELPLDWSDQRRVLGFSAA